MVDYHRIFSSLRRVLALDPKRHTLGEIAIRVINENILPEMEARIESEPDLGKRAKLEQMLDLWESYGDRRTPEGRSFTEEAMKIIVSIARKGRLTNTETEDLASDIVLSFYAENRTSMIRDLENFDYMKGVQKFVNMWKNKVRNGAYDELKKVIRRKQHMTGMPTDDEGKTMDVGDEGMSEKELRQMSRGMGEIFKEMGKYVRKKLGDSAELLFNLYEQVALDKGGFDRVNIMRDVFPAWNESTGLASSTKDRYMKQIKMLQLKYLEDVEEFEIDRKTKKKLNLVARVAGKFWRPRFATWMLELYRATKER